MATDKYSDYQDRSGERVGVIRKPLLREHVSVQKDHQSRDPVEVVKVPADHGFKFGDPVRVSGEPGHRQVMGQAQVQAHAQANRQSLAGSHRGI